MIRPKLLSALLALAACACAASLPTRIILTWTGDPASSQAVSWRMDAGAARPRAQVAPLAATPEFGDAVVTVAAEPTGGGHYAARFEGLKPSTRYTYRVGDGSTWSEWNVFRTASAQPEPFRFLYFGDAQTNIHSLWSRAVRTAFAAAPDARFMVHAGDLVTRGWDDGLWDEWCRAMGFISSMVPSLPVPGNHDLQRTPGTPAADLPAPPETWKRHFALPSNGPELLAGRSYYVDYQGVRMISLDVNVLTAKPSNDARQKATDQQLVWLEKVLRDNPNRWTVVFQHQPVYPGAKGRKAERLQELLVPVFDKYNVDLVLAGHDHVYARTPKMRAGKPVAEGKPGTYYAVSVSGPKMYELTTEPTPFAKTLTKSQLFQVVSVDGDRLTYDAYTIDGASFDRFEIRKRGRR